MIRRSMILAILCLLITTNVQSQGLGLHVAYQKATDAEKGRLMFGGALRLKLTNSLTVEGSIDYRQEKYNATQTVRSWPVMVTGMLHVLPIVYGSVGAGWYNTTLDVDIPGVENETTQEFGWHFGGGLEIPIGAGKKLTGDVRYVFLDYEFDALPFKGVDSNFFMFSVGILFGL